MAGPDLEAMLDEAALSQLLDSGTGSRQDGAALTKTFTLKGFNKPPPVPNMPGTAIITLAEGTSPAIEAGNGTNHLGLVCSGTTISASVNGVQLASVEDAETAMGSMSLWIVPNGNEGEVRFGNLVVMQP